MASRTDPVPADPLGLAAAPDDAPALWVDGDAIGYGELRSRVAAMTDDVIDMSSFAKAIEILAKYGVHVA